MRRPLNFSWGAFHSRSVVLKGVRTRHILEDVALSLDPESNNLLPHPLAIAPSELNQFIKLASGLEKSVGQVEREGGAVAILPCPQIRATGCQREASSGSAASLWRWGSLFANRFFKSQCL